MNNILSAKQIKYGITHLKFCFNKANSKLSRPITPYFPPAVYNYVQKEWADS